MTKLAIDGGKPVRKAPWPRRRQMGAAEKAAVLRLFARYREGEAFDRYLGKYVDIYEVEFARYHGRKFADAVSSGTGAVHSALGALRLNVATEVISSPITDPGGVVPILWCNCIPVFADVDPETHNVTPESIASKISGRTGAIIVAHIAGYPCDMAGIMKVARKRRVPVIEDCSQAHGATFKGKLVGSFGDFATFSLMSQKHMTSGGQGGMVLTDEEELHWNVKRFADRGKPFPESRDTNLFLGMNYRMTELQAVIGRVQLGKLERIVSRRRQIAQAIEKRLSAFRAVKPGKVIPGAEPSYLFMFVRVYPDKLTCTKAQLAAALRAEGIPVGERYNRIVYTRPLFTQKQTYGSSGCPWSCPFYKGKLDYAKCAPNAEKAVARHLTLSIHENLGKREVADILSAFEKVLSVKEK